MSYYTANAPLYWDGVITNARNGVLAFNLNDVVPSDTVARDGLVASALVTFHAGAGPAPTVTPVVLVGTLTNGTAPVFNGATSQFESGAISYLSAATAATTYVAAALPEAFGAVGNGVTNDLAALNAACASVSGASGGVVMLGTNKNYGLSGTLNVPPNVWLVGAGTRSSRLTALAGFSGTQVVTIGTSAVRSFGCGLRNLLVDANHLIAVGVFSDSINEQSGLEHVLVRNFTSIGVSIASAVSGSNGLSQNWSMDNLELYYSASAAVTPVGLKLVSTSTQKDFAQGVHKVTVNSSDGVTTIAGATGVLVDGYQGTPLSGIHAERVATGVSIGLNNASHGTSVAGVWGSSTVTDVCRIEANAGDGITFIGIVPVGATHTLVDVPNSITNTDTRLGFYSTGPGNGVTTTSNNSIGRVGNAVRFANNVGFYAQPPVARAAALTQTYSTAARTHSNPTAVAVASTASTSTTPFGYTTAAQADAIVTNHNALVADLANVKQVLNALIDDLQTYGLEQ